MSSVEQNKRESPQLPELAEDLANLSKRLDSAVVLLPMAPAEALTALSEIDPSGKSHKCAEDCIQAVKRLTYDGRAIAVALDADSTAVFCGLNSTLYCVKVAAIVSMPQRAAKSLMDAACEATQLVRQAELMQMQLDASAMQIAQSFEEQSWLRDLARNLSISGENANANVLARGILGPLLDLLRAEDLFVLVCDEETSRSGLASSFYGSGRVSISMMNQLMLSLRSQKPTGPIVINNAQLLDGNVQGLVAVPILARDQSIGNIVAINRLYSRGGAGLSLVDPEFGSVEVGLMEEASVLLSTQTHNIRLVLASQHLALGTLQAMSRAIDARDPYTRGHSERVARLSFEIAQILGLEETACQEIYVAGILHDVGKIGVPDRVLLKPGALTEEEFAIIKQHPEIGYRIVEQLGKLHFTLPGVLYHHERWDGGGYPHNLAGDKIPLMARIIAVADSFDAMTSSRPYRHATPISQACDIIQAGAGKQWDAMLDPGPVY